ncbi:RHS repeat domain-containing protein, partial [Lutispora sp.]|uniref:RHS repeat domain-containing protein n=1 Tax=Lutispora sp. TaxID=2828727 RepID=UPI002B215540
YCGYQFDTETGWYYLKNRYYASGIARFLTRDIMLNLNRYSYAANNPARNFDLGLWLWMMGAVKDLKFIIMHAQFISQRKKLI